MKKYLILLFGILLIPISVYANNEIILSSNNTKAKQGDTISINVTVKSDQYIGSYEYTLDYDNDKLELTKGNPYNINHTNDNTTNEITKKFSFKVLKSGTSKITVKAFDIRNTKDESLKTNVNPLTITTNKAKNEKKGYLSSLEVIGYKISPSFNKNTNKYTLNINKVVEKVQISAKAENKETVTGAGTVYLNQGQNKINIKVIGTDGNENTYTIVINVKDNNPITTTINGKKYTIIKDNTTLEVPNGYSEKKITIDNEEVIALYSKVTNFTLVGLKDENENTKFYIYDEKNNAYTLYKEIIINEFSFIPMNGKNIENYTKYNITIKDIDIDCYKLKSDSNYCLIYGKNTKTNKTGWYSYNKDEETLQKYNTEIDDFYKQKIKNTELLIYILLGTSLLFGILVIVLAVKNSRKKRINFKD